MKTANLPRLFVSSAGALLLAAAAGKFISIWAGTGLIHRHDPLFTISMPKFFWIVGALELVTALICLFGKQTTLQATLVLWLAMNFAVYQIGLWWTGVNAGFKGYLGDVSAAFGISCGTADLMLKALVLYLLTGSFLTFLWIWKNKESGELKSNPLGHPVPVAPGKIERSQKVFARTLKIACTACGGHIEFPTNFFGERIPCPHCQASIVLQKAAILKMSCLACDGHIAFPAHALGQTIHCPHCRTDITLKEPS